MYEGINFASRVYINPGQAVTTENEGIKNL